MVYPQGTLFFSVECTLGEPRNHSSAKDFCFALFKSLTLMHQCTDPCTGVVFPAQSCDAATHTWHRGYQRSESEGFSLD